MGKAHGLGSREMSQLARLWQRAGDPEVRSYLLAHPRQALARARGRSEPPAKGELGGAARRLLLGLEALSELGERVARYAQRDLGEVSTEGLELLRSAHLRAEQRTGAGLAACSGWLRKKGGCAQ